MKYMTCACCLKSSAVECFWSSMSFQVWHNDIWCVIHIYQQRHVSEQHGGRHVTSVQSDRREQDQRWDVPCRATDVSKINAERCHRREQDQRWDMSCHRREHDQRWDVSCHFIVACSGRHTMFSKTRCSWRHHSECWGVGRVVRRLGHWTASDRSFGGHGWAQIASLYHSHREQRATLSAKEAVKLNKHTRKKRQFIQRHAHWLWSANFISVRLSMLLLSFP